MNKKIKRYLIGIASVILLVIILVLIKNFIAQKNAANTFYVVKAEKYENVISVAGVVSANQEQKLQALSNGTVVEVFVKQGDHVKKGDVIIQLDDTTEQYKLAQHDYDLELTKINGSKKELALKQTERKSLVQKIAERKVTATFDGIIAAIDVSVGDSLEAKDSVGSLVDTSSLIAEVEIAETDVAKLKVGQEVEFSFPSYPGIVKGFVTGWPAIGEVTSRGATVVKAQLKINNYPESILPNFSFSGKIRISPDENYLVVERYAVARENEKAYVKTVDGKKIPVEVVPFSSEYVKIVKGDVKAGDKLKQLTTPKKSGGRPDGNNKSSTMGGMGGMPAMRR